MFTFKYVYFVYDVFNHLIKLLPNYYVCGIDQYFSLFLQTLPSFRFCKTCQTRIPLGKNRINQYGYCVNNWNVWGAIMSKFGGLFFTGGL